MILKNAKIVLEDRIINNGWVKIKDNIIAEIGEGETNLEGYNLNGNVIMPGFIDCHVHGGYGFDFEQSSIESFDAFAKLVTKEGVSRYCQGTVTGSMERLEKCLSVYAQYMENYNNEGAKARQIGAHLEGPFISKKFKGAHEEALIQDPNIDNMKRLIAASKNNIKIVTYAPELQDGSFTKFLIEQGIVPSMGHSAATFKDVEKEIANGAKHFTHLHNGMSRYDHYNPGMVNAALYFDEILCEFISDKIHNDVNVIRQVYKVLGPERICIITDAMVAKGMPDGNYKLGNLDVTKVGHKVTLKEGNIAGSAATYNDNVKNVYEITNCSLIDIAKMASLNVAKQLGIDSFTGSIKPNKYADLVVVDNDFNVLLTLVEGMIAYNNLV